MRMNSNPVPPKTQDPEKDDCPICGTPLREPGKSFEGLSRFDNKTLVCADCSQAEGTAFLFSNCDKDEVQFLQQRFQIVSGLSPWQNWRLVIASILGTSRGYRKKQKEMQKKMYAELEANKSDF